MGEDGVMLVLALCLSALLVFCVGLTILCLKYGASPYFYKRWLRHLIGILFVIISILVVMRPATDEFQFGLKIFVFFGMIIIALGNFVEAFEPDRIWHNRESRRATRKS